MKKLFIIACLMFAVGSVAQINSFDYLSVYREFNDQYFDNRLPKDVLIDDDLIGSNHMAETMKMDDGRFHISFNRQFTRAPRVMRMTMLHEMCHVQTWSEVEWAYPVNEHGPRWRTCMLAIDAENAFRNEWIDGFNGK